jgi:hypothetical protein
MSEKTPFTAKVAKVTKVETRTQRDSAAEPSPVAEALGGREGMESPARGGTLCFLQSRLPQKETLNAFFSISTETAGSVNLHYLVELARRATGLPYSDLRRYPASECRSRHPRFASSFFA